MYQPRTCKQEQLAVKAARKSAPTAGRPSPPDAFRLEYDSDEISTNERTWQLPPEQSFSDYTIVIVREDEDRTEQRYHVHKVRLATGRRRSVYFARLLKGPMAESRASEGRITLKPSAADAFPFVLNYIYAGDFPYELDSVTNCAGPIVAMRYLADYFDVRGLSEEVSELVEDTLRISTAAEYWAEAQIFRDEKLQDRIVSTTVEEFNDRLKRRPGSNVIPGFVKGILPALPRDLLRTVLSSTDLRPLRDGTCEELINLLTTEECHLVDSQLFTLITSENLIPTIPHNYAMKLLQLSYQYDSSEDDSESLELLRKRCIDAYSSSWQSMAAKSNDPDERESKRQKIAEECSGISSADLVRVLDSALFNARKELAQARDQMQYKDDELRLIHDAFTQPMSESDRVLILGAFQASGVYVACSTPGKWEKKGRFCPNDLSSTFSSSDEAVDATFALEIQGEKWVLTATQKGGNNSTSVTRKLFEANVKPRIQGSIPKTGWAYGDGWRHDIHPRVRERVGMKRKHIKVMPGDKALAPSGDS